MTTSFKSFGICFLAFTSSIVAQTAGTTGELVAAPGEVTDTAANPLVKKTEASSSSVGIFVKDGKAMLVRGNQTSVITSDMSLTISPNGTIKGFMGEAIILPEGQMLTMDGRFSPISAGITSMSTTPGTNSKLEEGKAAANEEMSRANSNSSAILRPSLENPGDNSMGSGDNAPGMSGGGSGGGTSGNRARSASPGSTDSSGTGAR